MSTSNTFVFYYPDGSRCSSEDSKDLFLDFYSKVYYILEDASAEGEIMSILKTGNINLESIKVILKWKAGRYYYNIDSGCFSYLVDKLTVMNSYILGHSFDLIRDYLRNICGHLYSKEHTKCLGIGPVYAIAIAYFHSKGRLPIFDRFAYQGINAIDLGIDPFSTNIDNRIFNHNLYGISLDKAVEKYTCYSNLIIKHFSEIYNKREEDVMSLRRVDQALWSYGHLFRKNIVSKG